VSAVIDSNAVQAIFALPQPDGAFEGPVLQYLRETGTRRPILLLAFAPKAAGTYLRQAAIETLDGQLVRLVHAQGGRDGTLYLPNLLTCYLDAAAPPIVSHVHMQALAANRHFIAALGLKPVIMLRDVADMLASFLDMLEIDPLARAEGLNCLVPTDFAELSPEAKRDFMIDVIAPWYASYFATWRSFAMEDPQTVLVLRYGEFCRDPLNTLEAMLKHAGFAVSRDECEYGLASVWSERDAFRFNKGVAGRGWAYFSSDQRNRLRRLLSYYPQLTPWMDELLCAQPTSDSTRAVEQV
jgi:hypothetical protein